MSLIGKKAPEFGAKAVVNGEVKDLKLSDYAGRWLVLFFYTKSNTGVCDTEVPAFNESYAQFKEYNADVVAISCNTLDEQKAYAAKFGLKLPLVSDESRDFTRTYEALNEANNLPWRGTYIIDPQGVVQSEYRHFFKIGRNVDEAIRMLAALQSGGACPVNWKPGSKTL